MSGVLDRMVQRSRGELPAVEPLVSSQRTAAALRPGLAEVTEEREAPASAPAPPREIAPAEQRGQRALDVGKKIPPARRDEAAAFEESPRPAKKSASPAQERAQAAESAPVRGGFEADERPRNLMRIHEIAEDEAGADTSDLAPAAPRSKTKPEPRVVERQILDSQEKEAAESRRTEAREPESAAENREAAPRKRNEIELEAKPATSWSTEPAPRTAQPASATPHAAAPGTPAATPQIETGEHTEIHITIGSVELRAPRTEAKAPPFRPRVTLDEFLRRRPGAES